LCIDIFFQVVQVQIRQADRLLLHYIKFFSSPNQTIVEFEGDEVSLRALRLFGLTALCSVVAGGVFMTDRFTERSRQRRSVRVDRSDEVIIRQSANPILLSRLDNSSPSITYVVDGQDNELFGEYRLSKSTCGCAGSLPELISFNGSSTTTLRLEPRISYSTAPVDNTWRAQYLRNLDSQTQTLTFLLSAKIVPRLCYTRLPNTVESNAFDEKDGFVHEFEIFSSTRENEASIAPTLMFKDEDQRCYGECTLLEANRETRPDAEIQTIKARYKISLRKWPGGATDNRAVVVLVARQGGGEELEVGIPIARESSVSVNPTKLFLSAKKGAFAIVSISAKLPFSIVSVACPGQRYSIECRLGSEQIEHQIQVSDKRDEADYGSPRLNAGGSGVRFSKVTVLVQTTHPDAQTIEIPIYNIGL
jgi:hypothetical protein